MRVKFRTNLGSTEAAARHLDYSKSCAGMEADVPDATGEWLVKRGVAEAVDQPVIGLAKPAQIHGVPKKEKHVANES